MIFRSHLVSMLLFAAIVAVVLGFIRQDQARAALRSALKFFLYMAGGVVAFGWLMHFL